MVEEGRRIEMNEIIWMGELLFIEGGLSLRNNSNAAVAAAATTHRPNEEENF